MYHTVGMHSPLKVELTSFHSDVWDKPSSPASTTPDPEHALKFDLANCFWTAQDRAGSVRDFPSLCLGLSSLSGRLWVSQLLTGSIGCWCWWLRARGIWRSHDRDVGRSNNHSQACLLSQLSSLIFFEGKLLFASYPLSFLLYSFYSCLLYHVASMPQNASELHANEGAELALSCITAVDAIQVSFLLR